MGVAQAAQMALVVSNNFADAAAVGMHADNIIPEVVKIADRYPVVAKGVDTLIQAGPIAGLVTATLPLVLQILANHKRIPADKIPGITQPEVLETQMKASIAKQAAQEMRRAQEAQAEYEREIASMQAAQNGSESRTEDASK
jgi:hypothetical protein